MLFLDDKNPDFDIPYHALVVGKKLGSGGFKDCYAGISSMRLYGIHVLNLLCICRHV